MEQACFRRTALHAMARRGMAMDLGPGSFQSVPLT
jgi:hypothetical protein